MRAPLGSPAAMAMEPCLTPPDYWDDDTEPAMTEREAAMDAALRLRDELFPSADRLIAMVETLSAENAAKLGMTREAYEAVSLRRIVREVCEQRDNALRELQIAVDEVCGAYVDAGHLARVAARFGICEVGADE